MNEDAVEQIFKVRLELCFLRMLVLESLRQVLKFALVVCRCTISSGCRIVRRGSFARFSLFLPL
jgi:hypothetical protein